MSKIHLAYDWFGPQNPLINNQTYTGNLYHLDFNKYGLEYFKRVRGYEPFPTALISEHDWFVYEIFLGHQEGGWVREKEMDLLSNTSISETVLQRIRNGRGYLLLDLAQESVTDDREFDRIHEFCKTDNIRPSKVIFQSGNYEVVDMYRDYCFRKGITGGIYGDEKLNIFNQEYFEFKTSFQMEEHKQFLQPKNVDFDKVEKTFLCFNRGDRYHRRNLLLLFFRLDLLKDSYFSMPEKCTNTGVYWKDSLLTDDNKDIYDRLNFTEEEVECVQKYLPLKIDEVDVYNVNALTEVWGNVQDYYNTSLISVVTETNYFNGIFNTEKIFRPIANRHPFIMVGPAYTLQRLKVLGYKTFSEFWDEEYDNIEDPAQRLIKIAELCSEINSFSPEAKRRLFYKCMQITDHNYRLLKNVIGDTFRNSQWHSFRDDIVFGKFNNKII